MPQQGSGHHQGRASWADQRPKSLPRWALDGAKFLSGHGICGECIMLMGKFDCKYLGGVQIYACFVWRDDFNEFL